jgi:pyruvate kinase
VSSSREAGLVARDDTQADLARLLGRLDSLLERLETVEAAWSEWLAAVAADYHASARNIVHYWAIRQIDLRELQHQLAGFGLSSLGRSEPHVQATRRIVRSAVMAMLEDGWQPPIASALGADEGGELLRSRTVDLAGPVPADRETRIMVTLPSEAATDPLLVRPQLERGMDVAPRATRRTPCCHSCIHGIPTNCPRWCPWIPK